MLSVPSTSLRCRNLSTVAPKCESVREIFLQCNSFYSDESVGGGSSHEDRSKDPLKVGDDASDGDMTRAGMMANAKEMLEDLFPNATILI